MTPASSSTTTSAFREAADAAVDDLLRRSPSMATSLGDHRFDALLADRTPEALSDESVELERHLAALAGLPIERLDPEDRADAEILGNALHGRWFEINGLREHARDPLAANPGGAIHALLARGAAPLADRLAAVAGRLAALPDFLAVARAGAKDMSRISCETAVGQFTGTRNMLHGELDRALEAQPRLKSTVDAARGPAIDALDTHLAWLNHQVATATGNPRIGHDLLARKLQLSLDLDPSSRLADPDGLLAMAHEHLLEVEAAIAEVAARMGGSVGEVLARIAREAPVDDATILPMCQDAFLRTTAYVCEHELVTVLDDPVEIILMPEIYRGVAVAYCDPPGPLEPEPLPTWFAVSPTPSDWTEDRVRSFYREYNGHMVQELTVHEAMPGHVLQLAHSRRYRGGTKVRAACWSGAFAEGWAVYCEQLMAEHGYEGAGGAEGNAALAMQRLKMQLRMTINTILDVGVHARGMTEEEAMRLMMGRGHQEEGEAVGKWRRALLTSAQLSTYFVGYLGVRDLSQDLQVANPTASLKQVHDAMLSRGTTAVRHVRALLLESGI